MLRRFAPCSEPLAAHPFNRLGGIVHLAMLLADMPAGGVEMLDELPEEVVHALQLNREWMQSKFPLPDSFVDISSL